MNNPQLIAPAATVLREVSPSSQWCQRWTAGRHSWRHTSEGGFDPARYLVEPISEDTARTWVVQHHYSGSYPAAFRRYGLLNRAGTLLGVCVLGIPMSTAVLTNVFPDLEPMVESLELSRLVLADHVPGNGETAQRCGRCNNSSTMNGEGEARLPTTLRWTSWLRRHRGTRPVA